MGLLPTGPENTASAPTGGPLRDDAQLINADSDQCSQSADKLASKLETEDHTQWVKGRVSYHPGPRA